MNMARRRFAAETTGNIALAGGAFGETVTLKPRFNNGWPPSAGFVAQ
jgi:hypothetical protein